MNEIDNGLKAHGAWKDKLKAAIDTGKIEVPITVIGSDNQCAFGKWLYGPTLSPEDKSSAAYAEIRRLHAEFHKTAARLAQLATTGKKAEAQQMLDFGSEYTIISGKLSGALKRWKKLLTETAAVK